MTDVDEAFIHSEAFNALCGDLISRGAFRHVFECPYDPTIVVKVEKETYGFHNVQEWRHWDESVSYKPVADWLAPCIRISPNGRVLIQRRTEPVRRSDLPEKIPTFLRDVKLENMGMLNGRIVCHDYAFLDTILPVRLKKAIYPA